MSTEYFSIVTRKGRALEATSKATAQPVRFSHLAIGDGGGPNFIPSGEMESLRAEKWRAELNDMYVDPDNPDCMIAEAVVPETVGGFTLREVGLFTAEGILYAVGSVAPSEKPVLSEGSPKSYYLRFYVEISADANVTLLIDPAKVLATKQHVAVEIGKVRLELDEQGRTLDRHEVELEDQGTLITAAGKKIDDHASATGNVHGLDTDALVKDLVPQSRTITVTSPLKSANPDLSKNIALEIAPGADGTVLTSRTGKAAWELPPPIYELCEFYYFRHPTLRPGFQPAQGGLLAGAATKYPEAWAYLKTVEGQKLCKTEAEWQAMTTATWATLADGTKVGWNGIGGAPFFAPNTATGALRLPDLRGMFAEAAGFDSLGVGGVHGDAMRDVIGGLPILVSEGGSTSGAFTETLPTGPSHIDGNHGKYHSNVTFVASRVVPIAAKNQPRAWGSLACVYLGIPAS